MITIFLTTVGITLLVRAYNPELAYLIRSNRLEATETLTAQVAWQLTKMTERYDDSNRFIVFGYLTTKKAVRRFVSLIIFIIAVAQLVITFPIELPYLFSIVLGAYLWVGMACEILRLFMRKHQMRLGLSLALAIIIPPCIYALLYYIVPLIHPEYQQLF